MPRLLHLADLHPNAAQSFAGKRLTDPETGKNQALTDLRKSLAFVLETVTSRETRCDAAVVAGDVFDSVAPTMDEVQVILEFVEELAHVMPVLVDAGNHDQGTSGTMATALEPLKYMSAAVQVFEQPGSTVLNLAGTDVRFFALPYPTKGRLLAAESLAGLSSEQLTARINQGLAAILRDFRSQFSPGVPNILMAHGSVAHAKVGEQPRSLEHDILLPVAELDPFTYTALGHIHRSQQVGRSAWYCGSLLRQGFGEEHEPKGFLLVEFSATDGLLPVVHFIENPHARRYRTLSVRELIGLSIDRNAIGLVDTVVRIKDRVTPDDYEALSSVLDRARELLPCLQVDVELVTEERARDAGMAAVMSTEEALARALGGKVPDDELPALLEKHRALVDEVAA